MLNEIEQFIRLIIKLKRAGNRTQNQKQIPRCVILD